MFGKHFFRIILTTAIDLTYNLICGHENTHCSNLLTTHLVKFYFILLLKKFIFFFRTFNKLIIYSAPNRC